MGPEGRARFRGGGGKAQQGIRAENAGRPGWRGAAVQLGAATGSGRGGVVSQPGLGSPGRGIPMQPPVPFLLPRHPRPRDWLGSLPSLPPLRLPFGFALELVSFVCLDLADTVYFERDPGW